MDQSEADGLLEQMGRQIAMMYDDSLDGVASYAPGGSARLLDVWQSLLSKQPEELKQTKTIQMALETFLHDALLCLQGPCKFGEFRIQARANGEWVSIAEYSDGMHGDLFDWLEENSKYGCVTNELVQMRLKQIEREGDR